MLKLVFLVVAILTAFRTEACTCDFNALDESAIHTAKSIVVFRIVEARNDKAADRRVKAQIEIIDTLRGKPRKIREIAYGTSACCGSRLDVGATYVLFTSTVSPTMEVNAGNLLILGYNHDNATIERLSSVIDGRRPLEDVFPRSWRERIEQEPVKVPNCR